MQRAAYARLCLAASESEGFYVHLGSALAAGDEARVLLFGIGCPALTSINRLQGV
jgi:hypothetical protein